jgi:hypothetical protein
VPRPDPAGDRASPSDRQVGAPGPDVVEQRQHVVGVERAVAVHERDVVARRGQQPGVHGGAVAGDGLVDHPGSPGARHLGGVVARPVVDHDDREPRGHPGQQADQRGGLVAARQHEVADGLHEVTVGRSGLLKRVCLLTK